MSMPSPIRVFESGLAPGPSPAAPPSFDAMIREKLETAHKIIMASDMPNVPSPSFLRSNEKNTLLKETGDYMNRLALISAKLAEGLVSGEHINDAAKDIHTKAQHETNLSDLSSITAFDVQLDRLRKMRDLTTKYSQDVEAIWRPETRMNSKTPLGQSPISPFVDMKPLSTPQASLDLDEARSHTRRTLPGGSHKSPKEHGSGSDGSDDSDDELFQSIDMAALGNRGKGVYSCPKGIKCTKGGVDKQGCVVAFERNSSFVQHCNKHRKPYRCTKENCPNPPKKRRFARRDGLERHLNTVAHPSPHMDVSNTHMMKA